jgi:hypothetical protein
MDFRAMLMRRKKPAKKVVVVSQHFFFHLIIKTTRLGGLNKKVGIDRDQNNFFLLIVYNLSILKT